MALTSAQLVAVREYMGYSASGNSTVAGYRELVYSSMSYMGLSIETRLANLSSDEEARVTGYYLANLTLREAEIQNAACNLDTAVAAVWTRNKNEIADRKDLFSSLRLDLCTFLGFEPGPNLRNQNRLVRA
jgi:hypothetical protein